LFAAHSAFAQCTRASSGSVGFSTLIFDRPNLTFTDNDKDGLVSEFSVSVNVPPDGAGVSQDYYWTLTNTAPLILGGLYTSPNFTPKPISLFPLFSPWTSHISNPSIVIGVLNWTSAPFDLRLELWESNWGLDRVVDCIDLAQVSVELPAFDSAPATKFNQLLSFSVLPANLTVAATQDISASSTSSLSVTITSLTPTVCTVSRKYFP